MKRIGLALIGVLLLAAAAHAQKPVNPTIVQFNPVASEYSTVVRVEIGYFTVGATVPVQGPTSIGKPPLTTTGCTAPLVDPCAQATINTQPMPFGMDYIARVRVVALSGTAEVFSDWSVDSNPFDRKPGKPGGPVLK